MWIYLAFRMFLQVYSHREIVVSDSRIKESYIYRVNKNARKFKGTQTSWDKNANGCVGLYTAHCPQKQRGIVKKLTKPEANRFRKIKWCKPDFISYSSLRCKVLPQHLFWPPAWKKTERYMDSNSIDAQASFQSAPMLTAVVFLNP